MSRHFPYLHPIALTATFLLGACSQNLNQQKSKTACGVKGHGPVKAVRTTAYTGAEGGKHGCHVNAVGTRLKENELPREEIASAAADWSRFPYGTKFRVKETGKTFVVDDYGSALIGTNTIDLYMPSRQLMRKWGVRQVNIELVEMGSYAKSLNILRPRAHVSYVRKMVRELEKQQ